MIIPFYQVAELWNKNKLQNLGLKLDLSSDQVTLAEPIIKDFTPEMFRKFNDGNVDNVTFVYSPELRVSLMKYFPDYYQPEHSDRISMLRLYLQQFELANELSKGKKAQFKRRYIKSLDAVEDRDGKSSIIRFNQELESKDIEYLKNRFSDEYNLKYTSSEKGILLVYDTKGYKSNPQMTKLQFQVRKLFQDIRYKRVLSVDIAQAFASYFKAFEGNSPKLVMLCGRTQSNEFLLKLLRVFDPFVKTMWLDVDTLNKDVDAIFDEILPKLGSDYSYENILYDPNDKTKDILSQSDTRVYRDRISQLSREFAIRMYIDIEYDLIEAMKKTLVGNQLKHLYSVLDALKISKDTLFNKFLEGSVD
jgi:hypothetical protein